MTHDLAVAIERFESALRTRDAEYRRREALWRLKQADIMELMCREQNEEISRARNGLVQFEPFDGSRIGNGELLARAKAALAIA